MASDTQELLIYWIKEREAIRLKKEANEPKPWSSDPVFQRTYFCNVRRENDTVTKFIRQMYNPFVDHPMFEYNIIFSRFINFPNTLAMVSFMEKHDVEGLESLLTELSGYGKIWGNAYVITTHGIKMPKVRYLCENVLGGVFRALEGLRPVLRGRSLAAAAKALEAIDGIGPFLAGQIVADLKNTPGHPLEQAEDWWTFAIHGPGSLRGASWFFYDQAEGISPGQFPQAIERIRAFIDSRELAMDLFCNQDLQNCLCEFDKYMRVKEGTGRSKRGYNGVSN